MKQKIIILIVALLAVIGLVWLLGASGDKSANNNGNADQSGNSSSATPPNYHADSGHIIAQVNKVETTDKGEFVEVQIKQVIAYSRDPEAQFAQLKANDVVKVYLAWGSAPRTVTLDLGTRKEVIELAGLKAGDTIDANIAGCPEFCNSGYGWTIYAYKGAALQ